MTKVYQSTVHVALCTHFMRIAFYHCIQTFGQGTKCSGWIELCRKTMPVPRINIIACSLVGVLSVVSDAQ